MIRFALLSCIALVIAVSPARAEVKLKVVATFSILSDLVTNVGGDRIIVETLVGPGVDTHTYTPKPTDVKKLAESRLVFVNGLGFESWLERLTADTAVRSKVSETTRGIPTIETGSGVPNPHAWQSVPNARIYVANIRDALVAADPASAQIYNANAAAYIEKLDRLDADIRANVSQLPQAERNFATTHPAFAYFGQTYGVRFHALQNMSHEAEVSAKAVADLIMLIRRQQIYAVFFEANGDPRLMEQIARETSTKIGGPLYADALTAKDGPAPTYVAMMEQNLRTISAVFGAAHR